MFVDARFFFLWQLCPLRVEHESGSPALVPRTLAAPSVQGHGLPQPQELWPYQSFFKPLVAGGQKTSLDILSLWLHPFMNLEDSLA